MLHMGGQCFSPNTSNYKGWKDKFVWIKGNVHCLEVIYEKNKKHQFPFYYTSDLVPIMGYEPHKLSATEREAVDLLERFCIMNVRNLFKYEGDLQ